MTVNHGVVGSSPTGGAKTKGRSQDLPFVLAFLFGFMPKLHLRRRRIMGEVACDLISERCLRANVVVRFKPGRGSHIGATILHPNTKVLDFQGLFVFLGVKNNPLSPLHLFLNLLDLNLRLYRNILK